MPSRTLAAALLLCVTAPALTLLGPVAASPVAASPVAAASTATPSVILATVETGIGETCFMHLI